ncbi:MAG: thiolase [Gordonia sp. (in: high G+C Gram-positive bacteria)]|nr:MAG: thiolase [Gordonia sp. (in: high G+C Gram-positive bacteria)]
MAQRKAVTELGFPVCTPPSTAPVAANSTYIPQQFRGPGRVEFVDTLPERAGGGPVQLCQAGHYPVPAQQLQEPGLVDLLGGAANLAGQVGHGGDHIGRLRRTGRYAGPRPAMSPAMKSATRSASASVRSNSVPPTTVRAGPSGSRKFMANGLAAGQGVLSDSFWDPFRKLAAKSGLEFSTSPDRSFAMDIYALWTKDHMASYGTTIEQIAQVAVKNHNNGALNDRAQYRFTTTLDEVLQDRVVASPLTRAMCAPSTDGAAAALVCSEEFLRRQPAKIQRRAIRVLGQGIAGGVRYASWEDERAPVRAAASAFKQAGISAADIDVVELHDASAFAEVHLIEDIGLCGRGEGGPFTMSGATEIGGDVVVSPSGGLLSRGHPIGATGLLMLREITDQLRGEAGAYQVPGAKIGLAENGGGFAGNDVAVCAVTILERA